MDKPDPAPSISEDDLTVMRRGFPKVDSYLKNFKPPRDGDGIPFREKLERYAAEGEFADGPRRFVVERAEEALLTVGRGYRWHAVRGALAGQAGWEEHWRKAVAYEYWSFRLRVRLTLRIVAEGMCYVRDIVMRVIGPVIGNSLALGWPGYAIDLSRDLRTAMDVGYDHLFSNPRYTIGHAQHFMVRLVADWQGWPPCAGAPPSTASDHTLNELLVHWRTPDLGRLAALLASACNRHTYQTRPDTQQPPFAYDFPLKDFWYDPCEVLSVLRLREWLGFPNPVVEHPLLATPLGKLHPPTADRKSVV